MRIDMVFSIIIPVYNVEKFLQKCLDHVFACELYDSEVILVLGNSNDGSANICIEYQNKHSNIVIIQQEDVGLSDARNCGLKVANGEYIVFLDSDDYIISNNFKESLNYIRKTIRFNIDVFISDFYRVSDSGKVISSVRQIEETFSPICEYNYMEHFLEQKGCFWNVWRYIYRKGFLIENQIFFRMGYLSEDIDYSVKVLLKAKKIAFFHNPYYCYVVGRGSSLMDVVTYKRVHDTVVIIHDSVNEILSNSAFPYRKVMIKKILLEFILNMATIYEVAKSDKRKTKSLFKQNLELLSYNQYFLARIISISISIFGISSVALALSWLKKIKRLLVRKFKSKQQLLVSEQAIKEHI
ncbi:glycosyltransferase [Paenibacillus hemerocallicola]|uniref:Glycosyltransferase n=1 Tax=Paenibacillus hemerocallicola TaxID=1172614 RepID=A0A5C4SWQ4_9BACL|nr:glycosyltransferase [Paenibacillus hemerocallicola]TNJ59757.1 glycosyltransferase [Paenibacillus hemerocallicola]